MYLQTGKSSLNCGRHPHLRADIKCFEGHFITIWVSPETDQIFMNILPDIEILITCWQSSESGPEPDQD